MVCKEKNEYKLQFNYIIKFLILLLKAVTVSAVLTWSGSLFHAVVAKCLHECKPNVVVLERGTYNFLAPLRL